MLLTFILVYILPMCIVLYCYKSLRNSILLLYAVAPVVNLYYAVVFGVYFVSALFSTEEQQ